MKMRRILLVIPLAFLAVPLAAQTPASKPSPALRDDAIAQQLAWAKENGTLGF